MKIFVVNCGSSSLKYQLIDMETESILAKGLCERIGIDGSKLTHKPSGKDEYVKTAPMETHKEAIKLVLDALTDAEHGVIADVNEITQSVTVFFMAEIFAQNQSRLTRT